MSGGYRSRVAVTGATGLVGAYVVRALVADPDVEVVASRRVTSTTALLGEAAAHIDWREGDLLDLAVQADLLDGCDAVVHAAGLVSYRPSDTIALRRVNVELTADLVNLALERGVKHFVHVSSIAAVSPARRDVTVDESQFSFFANADTTRYATSKYAAELEVWRGREEGLPVSIINPSVVLGAGFWDRSSCRLFGWVDQGQHFFPPGSTGYVDARDVAGFVHELLVTGPSDTRHILSAANWSYERFFGAVARELGVAPPRHRVTGAAAELAWRAEAVKAAITRRPPLLTRESARRSLQRSTYANAASVAAGAQYRPLEETIADVAASYRATKTRGWGILT